MPDHPYPRDATRSRICTVIATLVEEARTLHSPLLMWPSPSKYPFTSPVQKSVPADQTQSGSRFESVLPNCSAMYFPRPVQLTLSARVLLLLLLFMPTLNLGPSAASSLGLNKAASSSWMPKVNRCPYFSIPLSTCPSAKYSPMNQPHS